MSPKPPTPTVARPHKAPHADALAANRVPRPVSAFSRRDKAGHQIRPHTHERDQLITAIRGVMTVEAHDTLWTIPTSHGLWMPAEVSHSVRMDTDVEMHTLYFAAGSVAGAPDDCRLLAVSPLLRELIVRAMDIPPVYDIEGPDGRLMRVIVDEVGRLESAPLSLRLPADRRLARLCRHLLETPDNTEPIARLGARVGLSERSVIRLFPLETGLSLHRWRQQAKLMRAFALAEQTPSIGAIAADLGYSSPSAFAKMFRKCYGHPPTAILGPRR
ncbi:helix-turn-helix transcriptional regulator [uncultured Propionivibrio sp.]|uniref:AraC family transcriptional regulator n=1 Tax=uncultured Propionivibrio sp. TaxID=426737 RepID=UPI0029C05A09|nr:helix-turn-helix transcriptional regulator [uncultured Propionivibrio sp.]